LLQKMDEEEQEQIEAGELDCREEKDDKSMNSDETESEMLKPGEQEEQEEQDEEE